MKLKASILHQLSGNIDITQGEIIEHDIVVKMPPKNRFVIKAKILRIRKGKPSPLSPKNSDIVKASLTFVSL